MVERELPNEDVAFLKEREKFCTEIRDLIIALSAAGKSAHVGSSLSSVEILDYLFWAQPNTVEDVILSKGHAAMALYAAGIAHGKLSKEVIPQYLQNGSDLWGHPSVHPKFPFIAWSTGSLGHGLPVATGKAYSRKHQLSKRANTGLIATLMSDGELDEGTNWEAFLFAGHHRLQGLVAIVDYNKWQSFGRCEDVLGLEPLAYKLISFGWNVVEVDGHSTAAIHNAMTSSKAKEAPLCIVAHTIKGKGFPKFEDKLESHYKSITPELMAAYRGSGASGEGSRK
jgi:transketolase